MRTQKAYSEFLEMPLSVFPSRKYVIRGQASEYDVLRTYSVFP
jgi:hypothetical protein